MIGAVCSMATRDLDAIRRLIVIILRDSFGVQRFEERRVRGRIVAANCAPRKPAL